MTNNTVYQPVGDAVLVQSSSQNVTLRNNILWVLAGYDLNVAADSQVGFNSDYNDLFTTVTGKVAHWQGTDFATQADWFYRVGQDPHSFSADPQFVNPPGADGILGYSQAPLGAADRGRQQPQFQPEWRLDDAVGRRAGTQLFHE